MKGFLLSAALLAALGTSAQTVTIKRVELAGEKVIVHYDLEDNSPGREYLLNLYASKDNYVAPLTKVKGDVGGEVKPGNGRRLEWNLMQEYGGYKGKLTLEIRGKVFVPFVKLKNFDTNKIYKRGKNYDIAWRPGNTNPIHIELYKGSQRVSGELNHPNNGAYSMSVGSKVKPGKDYRLKITDSKKADEIIYSDYFQVKPKLPFVVKLIPALAVVGGIAFLAGGSGGESAASTVVEDIKDPPLPGGN